MTTRLALPLVASLLLASCDDASSCTTEDDCFRGELCTAQGKCAKPAPDMSAPDADMPQDMADDADMSAPDADEDLPPADMRPDLPAGPCDGVTCSGVGACTADAGATACRCPDGFTAAGDACIAQPAPHMVAAGDRHSCTIHDGRPSCWGDNSRGQLGTGNLARSAHVPTEVYPSADASHISAGGAHTCIIRQGDLSCWGDNASGQLGAPLTLDAATTPQQPVLTRHATAVAAGGAHTCAIHDGRLLCWGSNTYGQLGAGAPTATPVPRVTALPAPPTHVAAGDRHTCAITAAGALYCWGDNANGQLGDGGKTSRATPTPVLGMDSGVSYVAAGKSATCAVKAGQLSCWGALFAADINTPQPSPLAPFTDAVTRVSLRADHLCVIRSGGLSCWGANALGQLGNSQSERPPTPVSVRSFTSQVLDVAVGEAHSCAVKRTAAPAPEFACWGDNSANQIAQQDTTPYATSPATVLLP